MKLESFLGSLYQQIENLSKNIEGEIDEVNFIDETIEKLKAQNSLINNIHKITAIMLQIQKLEKLYEDEENELSESDACILQDFIEKIKSDSL